MYNFIGIDASLKSTAISIYSNKGEFLFNYTTENNKYIKATANIINYYQFEYLDNDNYNLNEIARFHQYEIITDTIINDILKHIDNNEKSIISIEGYSYSSAVGPIIDLVTFSTILKKKLFDFIKPQHFYILSPSTVKTQICKIVYNTFDKKRKTYIHPTTLISGGKFEKRDMLITLLDSNIKTRIKDFLFENKDKLLATKRISKPFDDLVDSILINNITMNKFNKRVNKIIKLLN